MLNQIKNLIQIKCGRVAARFTRTVRKSGRRRPIHADVVGFSRENGRFRDLAQRPKPALSCPVRSSLVTGWVTACALSGCATIDGAGYRLPDASLDGTQAFVRVVPRAELQAMAREGGIALRHGSTVNGLSRWIGEPGKGACFVYLAADARGYAALEHELLHCKLGAWHD